MNDLLNVAVVLPVFLLVLYNFRVTHQKEWVSPFTEKIETLEAELSLELFIDQTLYICGLENRI